MSLTVPIHTLKPHPIRLTLPMDVDVLTESIRQDGVMRPILITPSREVIDGQRTLEAAVRVGLSKIPARTVESWNQAMQLLTVRHARLSDVDPRHPDPHPVTPRRSWEIYTALKPFLYLRTAERKAAGLISSKAESGRAEVGDALRVTDSFISSSIYLYNRTLKSDPLIPPEELARIVRDLDRGDITPSTAVARADAILTSLRRRSVKTYNLNHQVNVLTAMTQELRALRSVLDGLGDLHQDLPLDVLKPAYEAASNARTLTYRLATALRHRIEEHSP